MLFNMILKNFCLFDVVFTLRARRGRSRPLAVYYLYAPLSRSNTGRGEEDLMIFAGSWTSSLTTLAGAGRGH